MQRGCQQCKEVAADAKRLPMVDDNMKRLRMMMRWSAMTMSR